MHELSLSRTFSVPVARLFNAWRDPQWLQRWFAPGTMTVPEADVDFRVGGHYRIVMLAANNDRHIISGEYLDIVANEKLCFSWQWANSPVRTEVEVSFRSVDGGCELHLLHRQFPDAETRDKHSDGWNGCLDKLAGVLGQ